MSATLCALGAFLLTVALPLLVLVALIDRATISQPRLIRLYRRQGLSQQAIADRLGINRYRVRCALT